VSYLSEGTSVRSWLGTTDHKRIGVMYLATTLLTFLAGGLFAMVLRIELLTPGPGLVDAQLYNRLFTLHGMVMVFLFMVPAIPSVFGNFFLPIMVGAKDVAFPRLNLATYWLFVLGIAVALWGMVHGGADTGWTFYAPYSTTTVTALAPVMLGIFIIGMTSVLTGLNFIVTVHSLRAPGLSWGKLPLFVWALYATSVIQVLATPVIGILVLAVFAEVMFGFGLFDPARGGDPILFQHLFWFYSHPVVYLMVLPAFGIVSEVVATFCRRQVFGYKLVAGSTVGIAAVGFFVWGHHMFVSGQSTFDAGIFGALSMLVGVFTAIKVFNWVMTLYKGAVHMTVPFAYACAFLYFLIFGGMTGISLAVVSLDVHWHDTYYVVAHFHFVMVGTVLMAFMAALHYWFPKMFGRMYNESAGYMALVFLFIGFNGTFMPQFMLGNMGMPRRYFQYEEMFRNLNVFSSAGAALLGVGFAIVALYLAIALLNGARATSSPWHSRGYEWRTSSPPPVHNFDGPVVRLNEPHDYHQEDDEEEVARGHA